MIDQERLESLHLLIRTFPFAAHVRDVRTGKYLIANKYQALNQGFDDIDEVTNVTYTDIYHYRRARISALQGSVELEDQYKMFIDEANVKANQVKTPLHFKICTLFPTGFIYQGLLTKIPILDNVQNVQAVLTFSEEKTDDIDLMDLYYLYKKHYPAQQAITQFLMHLKILEYFSRLPTNQELITLLLLRKSSISKYVAKHLAISYRTVEEYKARLRGKLINKINLDTLLIRLRTSICHSF